MWKRRWRWFYQCAAANAKPDSGKHTHSLVGSAPWPCGGGTLTVEKPVVFCSGSESLPESLSPPSCESSTRGRFAVFPPRPRPRAPLPEA